MCSYLQKPIDSLPILCLHNMVYFRFKSIYLVVYTKHFHSFYIFLKLMTLIYTNIKYANYSSS